MLSYSSNRFRILDDTQTLLMILIMFYEIDDHRMIVSDGSYLCNLVFYFIKRHHTKQSNVASVFDIAFF